jgi:Na+/melibiose symporter-like transporter
MWRSVGSWSWTIIVLFVNAMIVHFIANSRAGFVGVIAYVAIVGFCFYYRKWASAKRKRLNCKQKRLNGVRLSNEWTTLRSL